MARMPLRPGVFLPFPAGARPSGGCLGYNQDQSPNAQPGACLLLENIIIVGGGTAGWMAAASLAKFLEGSATRIHVIESSTIGTVGVGEATIPTILDFNRFLELDEAELMRRTQATFKLGILFEDWAVKGSRFFHPFANYGAPLRGVPFHDLWLRSRAVGDGSPMEDYCLPSVMARSGRFAHPSPDNPNPLADFGYAYQFDAALYAEYLRDYAMRRGVERTDARVLGVNTRASDGFIESVTLDSGQAVSGDLFVDCSGFRGLLIGQCLETPLEDWSHWLPANRAVAVQSESTADPVPYTRSITRPAGWQWNIPLQHRVGNGYVYCSEYLDDEQALDTLLANIQGEPQSEPNLLSFQTGMREVFWQRNCVALGLAAGFMEPLESTSIALIQTGIALLETFFPAHGFRQCDIDEANRQSRASYEKMRDFLILHYKLNQRLGEPFWDECRNMEIPEALAHKLAVYRSRAYLVEYGTEPFRAGSWLSMYAGFEVLPETYDRRADRVSEAELRQSLAQMRTVIRSAVSLAPKHATSLRTYDPVD
jgi:tryptophan halogenase